VAQKKRHTFLIGYSSAKNHPNVMISDLLMPEKICHQMMAMKFPHHLEIGSYLNELSKNKNVAFSPCTT